MTTIEIKNFTPKEIVSELDKHIIGQSEAKKSVAIALRNRWRRLQLDGEMKEEVLPKNILMIGSTGVGKTEIARRLAKLAHAPFIKVEATKFTEIGYVGRDVEQIIRDLVESAVQMVREDMHKHVRVKAEEKALEQIIKALVGEGASLETKQKFTEKLEKGELQDTEIEIEVADNGSSSMPTMDIPGMPGAQMGMINIGDMIGKAFGERKKKKKMTVSEAYDVLITDESDALLDQDKVVRDAIEAVEQNGIVFLDEIDKIAKSEERRGDVSREGVQRDLLPLIEGTAVSTKHGIVHTDHILFIASGAFHVAKPSDLLPELQGRLPNRVELKALTEEDFVRILTEPKASLVKQYKALMSTEDINLTIDDAAIRRLAALAVEINHEVENIGARRLHTVMEKLLEQVSFDAPDLTEKDHHVDIDYVEERVAPLVKNADLSKFIL